MQIDRSTTQAMSGATRSGSRRWRLVILGIVVGAFAVVALIVGAVGQFASATASSIDPVAEGVTPGETSFDADAERYTVSLVGGRRSANDELVAGRTRCTVTRSDGSVVELDGGRQVVSNTSANVSTVGRFDATAGPTTVFCAADDTEIKFVVDGESTLGRISMALILGGGAALAIAAALILLGVFWRKPARA